MTELGKLKMKHMIFTNEHIGKKLIMFREPTLADWKTAGRISIKGMLGRSFVLKKIFHNPDLPFLCFNEQGKAWYPPECFMLLQENYQIY